VAQKLTELKAQDGGDVTMSGSPTTVRWLLRALNVSYASAKD
jgi:hypothetical protein